MKIYVMDQGIVEYLAVAVPERVKQYLSVTEDKVAKCKFSENLNREPKWVLASLFGAVGTQVSAAMNVRKHFLLRLKPLFGRKRWLK